MSEKLPVNVQRYLEMCCGLSQRKIRKCRMNTRMFHDLWIYGEIAEDCIEELRDKFHVNIDGFDFYRHFPPEFHENDFLAFICSGLPPFVRWRFFDKPDKYAPLTLSMIEHAITSKKLENSSYYNGIEADD